MSASSAMIIHHFFVVTYGAMCHEIQRRDALTFKTISKPIKLVILVFLIGKSPRKVGFIVATARPRAWPSSKGWHGYSACRIHSSLRFESCHLTPWVVKRSKSLIRKTAPNCFGWLFSSTTKRGSNLLGRKSHPFSRAEGRRIGGCWERKSISTLARPFGPCGRGLTSNVSCS